MFNLSVKDDVTYSIRPSSDLSPRQLDKWVEELQAYGLQQRSGSYSINAWLLWNYTRLELDQQEPNELVQAQLNQRLPLFETDRWA